MVKLNTSLILTTLNESSNLLALLESILNQSQLPTELIVVDSNSLDNTAEIIKKYSLNHKKLFIRLFQESGSIAFGRNYGIKKAKYNVVLMTDAGCTLSPDWIENITKPFKNKNHILVAGHYLMRTNNLFEKACAPFFGTVQRKFNKKSYMPSTRSIAFNKSVWVEVGGFNEKLKGAGEDTLFAHEVIRRNIQIIRCPNAIVTWEIPQSLSLAAKKFFWYAKGDAQTGIWWDPVKKFGTHNIKVLTIYMRYAIFVTLFGLSFYTPRSAFILIFLVVSYLLWSIVKIQKDVSSFKAKLLIPLIQVVSDLSVMFGFFVGFIQKPGKNV